MVVFFGLSVLAAFVPGMPLMTAVTLGFASVVGFGAARLHSLAEVRTAGGAPTARVLLCHARFCDDVAFALCLLALLYALPLR